MTDQKIVDMLRKPAKPNLEEAKKYVMENGGVGDIFPSGIKGWHEAGNESAAQGMITRKYFPDKTKAVREAFYRDYRGNEVKKSMCKAGVEAWQAKLSNSDKNKARPWQTYQFYLDINLGSGPNYDRKTLYTWLSWALRQKRPAVWQSLGDTGVNEAFIAELTKGNAVAKKLAEFGYQNVIQVEDYVVFIKLPKKVSLEVIRGAWRMSDATGPARVTAGGDKRYVYRGVEFLAKDIPHDDRSWGQRGMATFDACFENGKIKLNPKKALALANVEQRRVIMESYEPEALLEACDAKLIDGKTALGNELFSVDIGIPEGSEWDHVKRVQVKLPSRQKMLRYVCPSTDRVYAKFVPPEMMKADEAQAWSHHFSLDEYKNIKQQS